MQSRAAGARFLSFRGRRGRSSSAKEELEALYGFHSVLSALQVAARRHDSLHVLPVRRDARRGLPAAIPTRTAP